MIRVAVIGVGAFGRNHARVVAQTSDARLEYVVDSDRPRAQTIAEEFGSRPATDFREIAGDIDAAIVAVPTKAHAEIGCALLEAGVDVLVEKPIASTVPEADLLIETAGRHGRILQVGHLERFNPVVLEIERIATLPLFFEIHRMSVFTFRSLDIDVVLDLMIHDLDIVLALGKGELQDIRAAGISILSPKVDIANVRLEFSDGCIANLTASRVSTEKIRKLRLFQPGQYVSIDYARQSGAVITVGGPEGIALEQMTITSAEPLKLQFEAFLDSVKTRRRPKLDGITARRTLEAASLVLDKINQHAGVVARTLASGWKP